MNWAIRSSPIHVGDKIAYARRFLQSIGCHIGDMASARGEVTGAVSLVRRFKRRFAGVSGLIQRECAG